jgi:very-short-patch-repair endonuclease
MVQHEEVIVLEANEHATPDGKQTDAERERYLNVRGIIVIRFWNTELAENADSVLTRIAEVCQARVTAH